MQILANLGKFVDHFFRFIMTAYRNCGDKAISHV
jgi:hypothetical protein